MSFLKYLAWWGGTVMYRFSCCSETIKQSVWSILHSCVVTVSMMLFKVCSSELLMIRPVIWNSWSVSKGLNSMFCRVRSEGRMLLFDLFLSYSWYCHNDTPRIDAIKMNITANLLKRGESTIKARIVMPKIHLIISKNFSADYLYSLWIAVMKMWLLWRAVFFKRISGSF